jgi:ribosomal protein S18 acetylase RimI-like enzyme
VSTKIRPATAADAPFLARVVLLASRSHLEKGVWDIAVPGPESECLRCIRRTLLTDTPSWCHYSKFIVAEVDGESAAALSGYPANAEDLLPMERAFAAGFEALGWGPEQIAEAFGRILVFLSCHEDDEPGAWIIEWVATLPDYRRRGLVQALMMEMLEQGRERGHTVAQIGILLGNTPAQKAYEDVGFKLTLEKTAPEFEAAIGSPGMGRLLRDY